MQYVVGTLLLVHAFGHLVRFAESWKLIEQEDAPYKTTLFRGRIEVGDVGIRLVGIVWLLSAMAFVAASVGALGGSDFWEPLTYAIASSSLFLCILALPEARIGIFVNVALLAYLVADGRLG